MSQKRKKWSAALKFEIVLLVIKGEVTLNEICKRYGVAPSQVHVWKKQFIEQGANVFAKGDKAVGNLLYKIISSNFFIDASSSTKCNSPSLT